MENKKTDLTEYSDAELSLWVFNDESLYRLRRYRRQVLIERLNELFIYTDDQLNELLNDLNNEDQDAE